VVVRVTSLENINMQRIELDLRRVWCFIAEKKPEFAIPRPTPHDKAVALETSGRVHTY
jgi:hypothetical protein